MLLLLLACAADDLQYAGCTVTAEGSGGAMPLEVRVYDDHARLVARRSELLDGSTQRETYTYAGDCLALAERVYEDEDGVQTTTSRLTCDEHGHTERVEMAGEVAVVYANTHDEQGRLVLVEVDRAGSESDGVSAYEWAAPCEEPSVTRLVDADGKSTTHTMTCRGDGRASAAVYESFDAAGERISLNRWQRSFDALGRLRSEAWDEGPGTPVTQTSTLTWGDALAPGPTHEERVRDEDDGDPASWDYTYACE